GSRGGSLRPGTCAFADRAVNSAEPALIRVRDKNYEEAPGGLSGAPVEGYAIYERSMFDRRVMLLSQFLPRSDYVIVLKVCNTDYLSSVDFFQAEFLEKID